MSIDYGTAGYLAQLPVLSALADLKMLQPVATVPIWLVCHQELRTSLRVRRVFDFIAERLGQSLTDS